ncbi:MAG: hypothetical protein WCK52_11775 [Betaproteobacteria bacterium]
MTLTELIAAMSIASIVITGTVQLIPLYQNKIKHYELMSQETAEVEFALSVIARAIRQAGFSEVAKSFPNITIPNATLPKKSTTPPLQIMKESVLLTNPLGRWAAQSRSIVIGQTDALIARHHVLGHFDCLGRRISSQRTEQDLAHLGFFIQVVGTGANRTGALMCQSLDQKGKAQNDSILQGVNSFLLRPILNQSSSEIAGVDIQIVMQSKRSYQQRMALRN